MAFSKGTSSEATSQIKRYVGIAPVKVRGINPTKDELNAFFGSNIEEEPVYISEVEINGSKIPQVRLDFLVETQLDNDEVFKSRVTFFLRKMHRVSTSGKIQVIDKYGRTVWVTPEEAQNKQIPVYSNGPANISLPYKPVYSGEEELIDFLRCYLNIDNPANYKDGKWVMKTGAELESCESCLDEIDKYFTGNISELKAIVEFQPENEVKVLFGVRTSDDGRQFQTTFTRRFVRNRATNYNRLAKELNEAKAAGAYSTSYFEIAPLHEYVVEPTAFDQPTSTEEPKSPWD